MTDPFSQYPTALDSPAVRGSAVVPDDETDLPFRTRLIYVGHAGDLALVLMSGDRVTLANVQAGAMLPVRADRVLAAGTTATAIVALA